jgi:hypothetical protein
LVAAWGDGLEVRPTVVRCRTDILSVDRGVMIRIVKTHAVARGAPRMNGLNLRMAKRTHGFAPRIAVANGNREAVE